jgi:hypothetical protein
MADSRNGRARLEDATRRRTHGLGSKAPPDPGTSRQATSSNATTPSNGTEFGGLTSDAAAMTHEKGGLPRIRL